ncbi:EAL domain-containing protein [Methylobacterium sp. E-046]|uniref:bifunctional diguanylate cyclase/phosphodiesterase n=1 Tax=Methylobacterium sp. E-046 TaxID=2836576 RepID=UPI001FB937ED|nr:EAL domain-containing protein [Methylobacterium sp. E-046]MCJ2099023.1 EAL domain-containing protein [Methylobacterium sp. E-046]
MARDTSNEATRLAALTDLAITDTPVEAHFDAVCRLARDLFGVPIALVSIVEEDRQWFLAKCGTNMSASPRDASFCTYTITSDEVFVVEDAAADARFATSPLVSGGPGIRFYAGAPLVLRSGVRVGALCVKDTVPRSFSGEQTRQLRDLAEIVVAHLRLHESTRARAAESLALRTAQDAQRVAETAASFGHWRIDVATRTMTWSDGAAAIFDRPLPASGRIDLDAYLLLQHPEERETVRRRLDAVMVGTDPETIGGYQRRGRIIRPNGEERVITVRGVPVRDANGLVTAVYGVVLDATEHARVEARLRESNELLRTTLESMDQGLIVYSPNRRVRLHNRRARDLLDLPETVLHDGSPYSAINAFQVARGEFQTSPAPLVAALDAADLASLPDVYERERPDGTRLEVRVVRLPDGGYVRTYTDITRRCASEARLRLSEERLALALDSGEDCLFDWNLIDGTTWVSERWRDRLGLVGERAQPTMSGWIEAIHPDDRERVTAATRAHLRGQTPTLECEYRVGQAKDEAFWVLARARVAARAPDGRALRLVGTLIDISRRKEAEARIAHMALYDALTGLPNRNLFREHLDNALRRAALAPNRHAVLALDLDHFKVVNDTYGHLAGDRLLHLVAERLRSAVRDADTVARLGGDEFAMILSDIDGDAAVRGACERIIAAVDEPLLLDGTVIDIGVSIGVALLSDDGTDAEGVFQRADMALFQAKAASRNTYRMYEAEAHARTATRSLLAIDMKEAIRRGDFFLVYQPIFNVTTGAIVSFEALMRWKHPVHGLISPSEFIPVAEETGLIAPLGTWALREACTEALNWPAFVRVSVNVSAVQFRGGLEEAVVAALSATSLPAGRLKLEVTESLLVQNPEQAVAVLHRLRALGVRLALDDFGTGYSSLSYLRRFPFDKIKIDRSFIRDIADPDAAAIVRAVVSIGERMGMGIVAEGVETIEQLELVRREGCTEVQGYIFSKPRSAADARALCCERPNDERSRSDTRVRTASEMCDQPSFPDGDLPSSREGNFGLGESRQPAEISGEPRFGEPIVDRIQERLGSRRKVHRRR